MKGCVVMRKDLNLVLIFIKESSPFLPSSVQTNCVDTTIANLLEGRVPFVPEAETEGFVAAAPSFYGAQDPSTSRMSPVLAFRSRRLRVFVCRKRVWAGS